MGVVSIVQFYVRMVEEPHFKARHPTAKIVSFKAIVLLTFVQDVSHVAFTNILQSSANYDQIVFIILINTGAFKNTETLRKKDFSIGLQSLLICIEQCAVSIWFQWTFSAKEYQQIQRESNPEKMNVLRAALDALNCKDLFAGSIYAVRLAIAGVGPKGNGSWKSSSKAFEPMKAPPNVRLHGVTSYQGSSSAPTDDLEAANKYSRPSYEMSIRPEDGEHPNAPMYAYDPSTYDRSRSTSPYGDERNPHRGAGSHGGHSHQNSAESYDSTLQVPASSLGRPQDRDQFYNGGIGP